MTRSRDIADGINRIDTSAANATAITVDASENVGIGTSSPSTILHLSASNDPIITLTDTGFGASADITGSNGNLRLNSQTATIFDMADSEVVRIDSSGRVGIGTSSPFSDSLLTLGSAQGTSQSIVLNGFGSDGESAITNTNANLIFSTGYGITVAALTERMRIDGSGNVLFGGATSTFISGAQDGGILTNDGAGTFSTSDDAALYLSRRGTTGDIVVFKNDTSIVGEIVVNSASVSYNTTSDHRLKENITGITDGIERVKQLAPSRFNFIADADRTVDGFLAHEAATVVPEAVTGTHNEVDDDGNPVYQGIDQSKLVPLLTAALQEAITKIETIETQNADFETRIAALETN